MKTLNTIQPGVRTMWVRWSPAKFQALLQSKEYSHYKFSAKLNERMEKAKILSKSKKYEITPQAVTNWLTGVNPPRSDVLPYMSLELDCRIEDFYEWSAA